MTLLTQNGINDNGLSSEEPDDAKVSRPARRGGTAARRATVPPTATGRPLPSLCWLAFQYQRIYVNDHFASQRGGCSIFNACRSGISDRCKAVSTVSLDAAVRSPSIRRYSWLRTITACEPVSPAISEY